MIETYQAALLAQIEDLSPGDRITVAERFVELVRRSAEPTPPSGRRWYRVLFEETEMRECLITAESPEEARSRVAEGDFDDSSLVETIRSEIIDVEDDGPAE